MACEARPEDVAARVVGHLQAGLDDDRFEPLSRSWKVFQGIQTRADAYTARIQRRLSAETRQQLGSAGAQTGDPIMELPPATASAVPWKQHPNFVVRNPESRAILYGAVDAADSTRLVVLRGSDVPPESVLRELERWRPVLATRAEFERNPRRHWWETAWPRDGTDMKAPKVIALYRTDRGRFALDEVGEWQPSIKATIAVGKSSDAPVAYLCGILNSELLDLWYAVRGKTPWHVRRNYEPKRMNEMPYRPPADDPRAKQVAALVRQIATNRRALLPHRSVAPELTSVVKDPWQARPLELDVRAMIAELPGTETISVRVHSGLTVTGEPAGKARRIDRRTLAFRRGRGETGRIVGGDPRLIDLLESLVPAGGVDAASAILVPRDPNAFEALLDVRRTTIDQLLAEGRELVEQVERLVCTLYDVPDDLAEEVVQHALQRAAAKTPSE